MNAMNGLLPSVFQNTLSGISPGTYGTENTQTIGNKGNTTLSSLFNNAAMQNTQAASLSTSQFLALSGQITRQLGSEEGQKVLTGDPRLRRVAESVLQEKQSVPELSQEDRDSIAIKIAEVADQLRGGQAKRT